MGRRQRVRDDRGRVLAEGDRQAAPLRRRLAHRRDARSTPARSARRSTAPASRSRRSPTTRTTCTPTRRSAGRRTTHLKKVIDAAATLDVPIVGTFVGTRPRTHRAGELQGVPQGLAAARRRTRSERGVKIAIENCPMIFSWDEWPGGTNLASTPAVWDEMFSIVPSERFGLNLDPSHLVWLMIDHERVVRDYASRIVHVHAKDMEIDREGLYRHGIGLARDGLADPAAARGSARSTGVASSGSCTGSATTTSSRSSTRTGRSRGRRSSWSEGSSSPATRSRRTSSERGRRPRRVEPPRLGGAARRLAGARRRRRGARRDRDGTLRGPGLVVREPRRARRGTRRVGLRPSLDGALPADGRRGVARRPGGARPVGRAGRARGVRRPARAQPRLVVGLLRLAQARLGRSLEILVLLARSSPRPSRSTGSRRSRPGCSRRTSCGSPSRRPERLGRASRAETQPRAAACAPRGRQASSAWRACARRSAPAARGAA